MTERTTRFACRDCGRESLRWEGRCPGCGAWNSLEEAPESGSPSPRAGARPRRDRPTAKPLAELSGTAPERTRIGFGELDRVLGGGLVPGSTALLGGPPGIGKSTLVLQAAARIASHGGVAVYVSGEESAEQVRRRATRLAGGAESVLFLGETEVDAIVDAAGEVGPALLCVDSVQTLVSPNLDSAPGTVTQVRECAGLLQAFAKRRGTPTVLVGHVTKGGSLAGPRTLEHLVDVVLHFDGPRGEEHRLLRATKNRFGRVGELAVFRMGPRGLEPVADPGTALVRDRVEGAPGSALTVTLEGLRPVAVEVQALTTPSRQPGPKRMATGFPARRLAMLLAVLGRRGGVPLEGSEVFVNVVGGFRISDPAADAAVLAALASAELDRALPADVAFLGEAGLSGELRGLPEREARLRELGRLGVRIAVAPARRGRSTSKDGTGRDGGSPGAPRVHEVATVRELVDWVRSAAGRGDGGGA